MAHRDVRATRRRVQPRRAEVTVRSDMDIVNERLAEGYDGATRIAGAVLGCSFGLMFAVGIMLGWC